MDEQLRQELIAIHRRIEKRYGEELKTLREEDGRAPIVIAIQEYAQVFIEELESLKKG